jgi:hypothetical protein
MDAHESIDLSYAANGIVLSRVACQSFSRIFCVFSTLVRLFLLYVGVSVGKVRASNSTAGSLESDVMPTIEFAKRSTFGPAKFLGLSFLVLFFGLATAAQTPQQPDSQPSGSITGRVIDQSGVNIGGAQVILKREDQSPDRTVLTDSDGQFFFAKVAPGPFHLTISSEGLASQEIPGTVEAGEPCVIPLVMLVVATQKVEVQVTLTQEEIAYEQIRDQEKQRVFGIIPNFYVTYDHNAVPLNAKQKFHLAWKSSTDPITFLGVGTLAGVDQAGDRWHDYGQGLEGYAKRYGATYADVFAGTYIGGAILPSILKQDPRYFYKGTGSKRSRLLYAIGSSFFCKGDNGRWQPNYSNIGGDIAAGAISNLYYPAKDRRGVGLVFSTALVRLGETTVAAIFQEFLVPKLTPNLPTRAPTQQ